MLTTLRAACLFLMQCKVEYKTCVRLESGAEGGFAAPRGSVLQGCPCAIRLKLPGCKASLACVAFGLAPVTQSVFGVRRFISAFKSHTILIWQGA